MNSAAEDLPFKIYDGLSNDKKTKIEDLKEILKEYNREQCLNLLEANYWNIEASIDSLNISKSEAVGVSTIDSSTGIFNHDQDSDKRVLPKHIANEINIPAYMERIESSPLISKDLHPWLYKFIMWTSKPLNMAFSLLNFIMKYLVFWKNNEMLSMEIYKSYENKLMELLSASLLIPDSETGSVALFLGNFEEAVAQAKYEYKFLLVYLHRLGDNDSDTFLSNSFLHSEVIEVLNDPDNILIWAGTLNNSEGQEVANLLQMKPEIERIPDEYFSNPLSKLFEYPEIPFLFSLLSISSNTNGLKLTVIGQLEKIVQATELKDILLKWIEIGSRPRLKAKREKSSRDAVNNLRKMQEVAFNEMLERDQRIEAKIIIEKDNEKMLLLNKEIFQEKLKHFLNKSAMKKDIKSYVQLLIKFPNGRRCNYQFDMDSSIKILYYVVFCEEDAPKNFELLWNYPRQVLNCKLETCSLNEFNLEPQIGDPPTFRNQGIIDDQIILVRDLDV